MKTKLFLAITATLIIGIAIGAMGHRFLTHMNAYSSVSIHVAQGRSIMEQIEAFKTKNGKAPGPEWFSSLDDGMTKTSEGYQWIYLNPPLTLAGGREIVILTATDYNNRYLCGFSDWGLTFSDLNTTKKANETEMATPRKPSDQF